MNSNTPFYFCNKSSSRGVSPVIASVIILAITVVLGLSLWSFVNGQVSTSTQSFANEVTDYVNYVNDRFVMVNTAFNYDTYNDQTRCPGNPPSQCASVWIYNNGNVPVKINGVFFGSSSSSLTQINVWYSSVQNSLQIAPKTMGVLSFNSGGAFAQGSTYYVKVVSVTGAYQTYYQKNG